jgi:hypothetical protein
MPQPGREGEGEILRKRAREREREREKGRQRGEQRETQTDSYTCNVRQRGEQRETQTDSDRNTDGEGDRSNLRAIAPLSDER